MKSEIEKYVIEKVKQKRVEFKFSQADLAHHLDLSNGFIGKIESPNHHAKYNLNHINVLAKIFNCSPTDFLPTQPL